MITTDSAITYVQKIEASWELPESIIRSVRRYRLDGDWVVDVNTQSNRWTVWIESTGQIYGEC